jgi:hypothetical protein
MKVFRQTLALFFFAASMSGRAADMPLPTIETILQHVEARAKTEAQSDRAFDQHYSYSRSKVTEFLGNDGSVKKREEKDSVHQPNVPPPAKKADAKVVFDKSDESDTSTAVSDTHSNIHGQVIKKNDILLDEDLINRFKFTLTGTETINGRPAYVVDFVPAKKDLPEHNLKDRFINKAAGRVWVDEQDYALVKADLHLTKPVDVAWGLVGAVWKFNYGFDRARTPDGYWFTKDVNWHLQGREVVVDRTVDYHESTTNVQPVSSVATR